MMRRLLPCFILIAVCSVITVGQTAITAIVTEAIDGRTLALETSAGRIVAQLQYIEVPADGQPLFDVTRAHLSKLTFGKSVELKPQRMVTGRTIGRVTLEGVDLSLQMIRDGAAWHEPKDSSGQHPDEAADYDAQQLLAKNEKRGVWSIPTLKTPWEVRAQKEKEQQALETARRIARPTAVGVGEFHSDTRRPSGNFTPSNIGQRTQMNAWVNVFAGANKEGYGLLTHSDPKSGVTVVYTSGALIDVASPAGTERLEFRALYVAPTYAAAGREKMFLLGFRAISTDYRFSKGKSRVTIVADGQRLALGTPFGLRRDGMIGAEEIVLYRISWATLRKIGKATNVEVQLDKGKALLPTDARELMKQLAEATS
jgi:endonuclease YncB( thermonuclease family)